MSNIKQHNGTSWVAIPINADKLMGYVPTDFALKTDLNGLQNYKLAGVSTFNSITGRTISDAKILATSPVYIMPKGVADGTLGEWSHTVTNGSFTVYCTGSNTTMQFTYIVY